MDRKEEWWMAPEKVRWCHLLIESFRHWTRQDLVERTGSLEDQAGALYAAPFVVVSHGAEPDPILNYGNHVALNLWEATWEQFRTMASRLTAELVDQAERERMLARTTAQGFIEDYRGIRISSTGKRFLVDHAIVWNVIDRTNRRHGQAAMFSHWIFL